MSGMRSLTWRRWVHRRCDELEAALSHDRDRAESEEIRLRKQYDDLLLAYRGLAESALVSMKPPLSLVQTMFDEAPSDETTIRTYLTPSWAEREGDEDHAEPK